MIYGWIMPANKLTYIFTVFLVLVLQEGLCVQRVSAATTASAAGKSADVATTGHSVPEIYLAARNGNLNRVRSLIADGMDINVTNFSGRTALMSAVYFQNKSIVRELVGEGADLNVRDAGGRTALMLAVSVNNLELIEELIAAGADVNIADNGKNTALSLVEKSSLGKSRKKQLTKLLEAANE